MVRTLSRGWFFAKFWRAIRCSHWEAPSWRGTHFENRILVRAIRRQKQTQVLRYEWNDSFCSWTALWKHLTVCQPIFIEALSPCSRFVTGWNGNIAAARLLPMKPLVRSVCTTLCLRPAWNLSRFYIYDHDSLNSFNVFCFICFNVHLFYIY